MCRIVGIIDLKNRKKVSQLITKMRDTMSYGGPDDQGVFLEGDLALGHRRLSILDTSKSGQQPMIWQNLVITYNGEVYNFKEIQKELIQLGHTFSTGTDTEVILKAFEQWHTACVHKFRGMFAFAIWNRRTKTLLLCRDRVGVKPLYWYKKGGLFMFASELKAFHEHPDFDKSLNHQAVNLFLQQGYIQAPHCIFKYAKKLKPGHFLSIDEQGNTNEFPYWEVEEAYQDGVENKQSEQAVKAELKDLLKESFSYRMVSDVPVGMFLSGGIDSSLVTAMLQKESNQQLKTFTIGFADKAFNEAHHAQKVADHIGTDHTELICTETMFQELLAQQADFYDEPFGDESAIPTYLVANLAKSQVKVCLSADGGDELFGGYTKYEFTAKHYPKLARIPTPIKQLCAKGLNLVDAHWLDQNKQYFPILKNYTELGSKIPKFTNALLANNLTSFFNNASSTIATEALQKMVKEVQARIENPTIIQPNRLIAYLGTLDISTYLEGEIMPKVDRATMQTAVEGREPMLDHHLIEYALQLPDNLKIKNGQLKYILRSILYDYVPKQLIDRPKHGFAVPIHNWLHGFLKKDLVNMMDDKAFFTTFQLDQSTVQTTVTNFLNRDRHAVSTKFIWLLLMLYRWSLRWMK